MKKQLTRVSLGILSLLITLSCGGTTGYYLLTAPATPNPLQSQTTTEPLQPQTTNNDLATPAILGLSSGSGLGLTDMPYPLVGDIADLASMGGVIYSYNTSTDFQNTIDFYKLELARQGYLLATEHTGQSVAVLEFTNANHTLNITITLNLDTNVVNVMMIES